MARDLISSPCVDPGRAPQRQDRTASPLPAHLLRPGLRAVRAAWLPATLGPGSPDAEPDTSTGLILLGSYGPLIAALGTTALLDGRAGFRDLGRRLRIWRVKPYWYAFVLVWPALLSLAATAVSIAQQLVVGSSLGEEPGWRGYALPRMQWQHGALRAGLVLGLLWGLWHLPLWLWRDHRSPIEVGWELLGILAMSVLFTWVFNHTEGSLMLAMLFHASIATTGLFLAESHLGPAVEVLLAWMLVALLIVLDRR